LENIANKIIIPTKNNTINIVINTIDNCSFILFDYLKHFLYP